jgi:DNA-binding transcriptional ArsR family regulator
MVEHQTLPLDTIFHALSDGTRRSMLADLAKRQRTVSELAEPFSMSLAAASKHIKVLESAGLLRREIQGRVHLCRLEPKALATAHQWLSFYEGFWTDRLNVLDQLLRADGVRAPTPSPPPPKGEKP